MYIYIYINIFMCFCISNLIIIRFKILYLRNSVNHRL